MNETIRRFNESALLSGDGETFDQLRAVSNALTQSEREIESEARRLRESGLYTDEGVAKRMEVFVQEKENLLQSLESDVLSPREQATRSKIESSMEYATYAEEEATRAYDRYNAGDQFKREMIATALNGDKKLASILADAPDYLLSMSPSLREQLKQRAFTGDRDSLAVAERQLDAIGYLRQRSSEVIDSMRRMI